jgi:secondary thiamine-phosphate synthase enzyme
VWPPAARLPPIWGCFEYRLSRRFPTSSRSNALASVSSAALLPSRDSRPRRRRSGAESGRGSAVRPRPSPSIYPGVAPSGFQVVNELLVLETGAAPDFVDITDQVEEIVSRSGVANGQALVFCRHTTAAVRVQEAEPLLLEDMIAFLQRLAPREAAYRHNDFRVRTVNMTENESPNGHSHCQHLFLGASETVPVNAGRLTLGRWQRLFLIELDHPRRREVHVQVMGLGG